MRDTKDTKEPGTPKSDSSSSELLATPSDAAKRWMAERFEWEIKQDAKISKICELWEHFQDGEDKDDRKLVDAIINVVYKDYPVKKTLIPS